VEVSYEWLSCSWTEFEYLAFCQELQQLSRELSDQEMIDHSSSKERRRFSLRVHWLVRRIAFLNPLLNFDQLLFVKRHDAAGVFHMCDQYYGCNAVPGGGLYILSNPLGPNPQLTNLLEGVMVKGGRLIGLMG
jgi:hypothetical protein